MNRQQELVYEFHEATNSTIRHGPELTDAELRAKLIMEEAVETVAAMGFAVLAEIRAPVDVDWGETPEDMTVTGGGMVAHFEKEFKEADFVEVIDGLCDLLYVVYGSAVSMGIDLDPFFEEVHRSNMDKLAGPKREDGKQLKPEGWQPPNIQGILDDQIAREAAWTAVMAEGANEPYVEIISPAEVRHERLLNGEPAA